jgi:formylglycine-generating enzyme required for sulfatase activity
MWQWCWDWYGPYAGGSDPRGSTTGTDRVYRGGTWENPAYVARTAFRSKGFPYDGSKMGFRSVLPPR